MAKCSILNIRKGNQKLVVQNLNLKENQRLGVQNLNLEVIPRERQRLSGCLLSSSASFGKSLSQLSYLQNQKKENLEPFPQYADGLMRMRGVRRSTQTSRELNDITLQADTLVRTYSDWLLS